MPVARRTILQGAFQNYDSLIAKNYIVPPQNNPRGDLDSNPVQTALCITIHSCLKRRLSPTISQREIGSATQLS